MNIHSHNKCSERGVITLLTVILLSATMLSVGLAAMFIGQTEVIIAGHEDGGRVARITAMSCIEEGMYRLKLNDSYSGGVIPGNLADCTLVVSGGGSTRTLVITSTFNGYTKNLNALAEYRENVAQSAHAWVIDSWTEVDL